ncbi:MAG: DUF420 domain-containing protein [Candidatus Hydrogenedentes bacterium]|nr:DUF420 domain-containing protein [Candidatus Hydrogenedentota bacterium]
MTTHLPTINAILNGTAALLLLAGRRAIKSGKPKAHQRLMLSALTASAAFLACYLYYHFAIHGMTRYQGQGALRYFYFFILATHTPLAAIMPPFIALAVWHAAQGRLDKHIRITRWLWPVWMYVSVTGVAIYLMLYQL